MTPELETKFNQKIAELENRIKILEGLLTKVPHYPQYPHYPQLAPYSIHGCPVCGIGRDGKTYGYVCQNPNCPSTIRCQVSTTTG